MRFMVTVATSRRQASDLDICRQEGRKRVRISSPPGPGGRAAAVPCDPSRDARRNRSETGATNVWPGSSPCMQATLDKNGEHHEPGTIHDYCRIRRGRTWPEPRAG